MKHFDFIIIDALCFQFSFILACIIRHGLVNPYLSVLYRNVAFVGFFVQVLVLIEFRNFHNVLKRGYYQEFVRTIQAQIVSILMISFYLFIIQQGGTFSRIVLLAWGVQYGAFSYLARCIWKYILHEKGVLSSGKRRMVLISTPSKVEHTLEGILQKKYAGFSVTGIIIIDEEDGEKEIFPVGSTILEVPVVADEKNALEWICRDWVDEVFLDLVEIDPRRRELLQVIIEMGMVAHVNIGDDPEFVLPKKQIQTLGHYTVLTVSSNMLNLRQVVMKRALDILGGLVGCLITAILFVILGPIIYIKSPGPIFFSQMRVGRNGKLFKIYKFRSMYMDAEERKKELMKQNTIADGMMFKLENDPRIIGSEKGQGKGIGNFIRETSLDEFPQFFNILKGDMSLVGTRPPTVDEWEKYDFHHRGRLSMKPGLTGMWQVSGRSNILDFEEVVALDRTYINEWSFVLDFKILLKTVSVVLKREGSK